MGVLWDFERLHVINVYEDFEEIPQRDSWHCYFTEIGLKSFESELNEIFEHFKTFSNVRLVTVKAKNQEIIYQDINQVVLLDFKNDIGRGKIS